MGETYLIRRARLEDQEVISRLWLMLLKEQTALEARFGVAGDALRRWRNDFPLWLRDETRQLLVAERAHVIVGFITGHTWEPPPIYAAALEVYVDELYVRQEVRRQGVGTRLVEAMRQWASERGARRLRLSTLAANEAGRAFWERQQAQPFSVTLTMELQGTASPLPPSRKMGF